MKTPHRTITIVAFSLMALNAVLLAYGAAAFAAPRLYVPAALCALAALGVLGAWRWYRRNLAELDELRELLRSRKP